ncbi:hypothetical protein [Bacillus sp. CGMCC 1.16541]|uniref:hypothetical protein n=1 Tax=Bacillus sp. CGMCC 1.16541 TaxID=2185143 RepID=UPI000D72FC01|nr:hypothetical protein [Bacillus sp. CGMCC 1.16541]
MEKAAKVAPEQFKQPEVTNMIDVTTAWSVPLFSLLLVIIGVVLLLKFKSDKQVFLVGVFISVVGLAAGLWLLLSQSGSVLN